MTKIHTSLFVLTPLLALTLACSKPEGTEKHTESTTSTPDGAQVKTTEDTKQVGENLEAKTETKVTTDQGSMKTEALTVIGTVTVYEVGKKLEVLTGDKESRTFDLSDAKTTASIAPDVKVGSRVTVTQSTGDSDHKNIKVDIGG